MLSMGGRNEDREGTDIVPKGLNDGSQVRSAGRLDILPPGNAKISPGWWGENLGASKLGRARLPPDLKAFVALGGNPIVSRLTLISAPSRKPMG